MMHDLCTHSKTKPGCEIPAQICPIKKKTKQNRYHKCLWKGGPPTFLSYGKLLTPQSIITLTIDNVCAKLCIANKPHSEAHMTILTIHSLSQHHSRSGFKH